MLSLDQITDNFRKEISEEPISEGKVLKIVNFCTNYFDTIGSRCLPFIEEGINYSRQLNYTGGEVLCLCNQLFYEFTSGDAKAAQKAMEKLEQLMPLIKDKPFEYSYALSFKAYQHWFRGEFEKGFDQIFESMKLIDQLSGQKEAGWIYYALGVFYFDTKDMSSSDLYYSKAAQVFENANYSYGSARSRNGIASVKIREGKSIEAVPHLEYAVNIYREGNYYSGLGRALNDLGLIEKSNKNYQRTIALFEESLEIRKEINHTQGLITSYTELGEVYLVLQKVELALKNLQEALRLSDSINAKYKSIRLHKLLSDTFKQSNNIQEAFDHFEKFHNLQSEILSEESAQNIRKLQTKIETERSEKEAEIERLKNVELKHAHDLIAEKQKEILDSIRYAKRIQQSLLPTDKYIERNLKRLQKKH